MKTPSKLTPATEDSILAGIRSGGFPHVAAAAFGIPHSVFKKWLRRAAKAKNSEYAMFARKVEQAQATARLNAEIQTHHKDPRLWLRSGPGRETPTAAGWTTFVRSQLRIKKNSNLF